MAFGFWKRKSQEKADLSKDSKSTYCFDFNDTGIIYPYLPVPETELDFYWQALEQEGYADLIEQHYILPWSDLYLLLADPEHQVMFDLMNLPEITALRPMIRSEGALSDPNFKISREGWCDSTGIKVKSNITSSGAILTVNEQNFLLPQSTWKLLDKIREFARLEQQKTKQDNEKYWGNIRRLAKQANASMDEFLRKTIVLTPETLQLNMRRNHLLNDPVIEIQPVFEGAPESWLNSFDRYNQVQPRYDVTLADGGIVHILIDEKVKNVLAEIKKMPQRRVTGERANTFLHNPYAQLGDEAKEVISPESFEQSKQDAEIYSYNLRIFPVYDQHNLFQSAQLKLLESSEREREPIELALHNAEQASYLVNVYQRNQQFFSWAGYEVILDPVSRQQLEQLDADIQRSRGHDQAQLIDQVLNLENYSQRVIGIGEAPPIHSEFIQRDIDSSPWLPEHIADLYSTVQPHVSDQLLHSIDSAIEEAQQHQAEHVQLPHIEQPVSLAEAQEIQQRVTQALQQQFKKEQTDQESEQEVKEKKKRQTLIISDNIDEADFRTQRSHELKFDEAYIARLPKSFRSNEYSLKAHQQAGVAWLQNLYRFAPEQVNGCLLADDMGLGKTLQLLCFIGEYLEKAKDKKPVLIVAPVSLLENWQAEASRFFNERFGKILSLYGDNLKSRKLAKHLVPVQLRDELGITNLLERDWRGDADIVLTTYETLRDLEFSLSREHWSIMICDEAQKIKVPSAMVTKAAKAQNADFKIACTGTPVENSLTDLWCLFDFIQADLLGSLNEFGRTYRRPIEQSNDPDALVRQQLQSLIEPQILRRMKQDVADLPDKIEHDDCKQLAISKTQQQLYAETVQHYRQIDEQDRGKGALMALHKMRMICAHPFKLRPECPQSESPKVKWLLDTLKRIQAKEEKVIIFTEFRDIQVFLQKLLMQVFGLNISTVNGDTSASSKRDGSSRQGLINQFQSKSGFNVIILSTTAVGFGVNVQKANHVIHYTRCWNPAKEDQATDRAYRIGQEKNVFVYYPSIYSNDFDTFEIKLDRLLNSKRQLATDILSPVGDISIDDLAKDILHA